MNVYVMTCDKYLSTVKGFAYLFNKYWYHEQPVTVLGFSQPTFDLPPNFSFQSLGVDSDYPVERWSDALLKFLNHPLTPKYFTLFLEDYWIKSPVNVRTVKILEDYAMGCGDIIKVDLSTDRQFSEKPIDMAKLLDIELLQGNPEAQYHMSLYIGLWNRDLLRRVLIPNETPWQVELDGTNRLRALRNVRVIGTRNNPVPITLVHRNGDPKNFLLTELCEEDQATIHNLYKE